MIDDDIRLVQESAKGNTKAFEALVDKYQKTVFNAVYRMVRNFDEAEDITQSVFIKVYEGLDSFNSRYKFFSWIYRIAVNESLNHLKHARRSVGLDVDLVSAESSPEEQYEEVELSEKVQNSLMELDPEYRCLIVLKHFQNCSYQEMAYILDISEKKVKSRLFTARQLLKDILVKNKIFEND